MEPGNVRRVSLCTRQADALGASFCLTTFGQLKLSVEVQGRVLVLHVMEAKGLMGKEYQTCDSYVKMSIVPDADWKCRQKTKTVPDSKNPVFHEHFLFPVQEEDEQKRLLVTVWNRERNSRQSELIGCMSFGVKSLLTLDKEISGWYYLLGEDLGRTKHLKVATQRLKQNRGASPRWGVPGFAGEGDSGVSLQITIPRGSDGFGFTICCDSPVRVQAVDSGGPAEKAGLQQLDTVLQLNQQPVEHWKCVDLAHEIRNCPTEIILLVWRLVPQVKSGHEGTIRRSSYKSAYDLQSPPNKREKNSTVPPRPEQRRSCHVLYDGSDGLVLNSWERYTEIGKRSQNTMPPLSRVPSTADPNYIILAPLNPGSQLLRPVYQENNSTVGEEAGNAGKGKSHTGSGRKSRLMKTVQTMKSYGNYQNCTIVRPHIPHSSYGTYVTLAPKVLVFPVFVQPADLCNPARTLLLSEELLLHESRSRTIQVTLFVYSDLLLFTKEDEPGRCNVLRNPLYLQSVKLQEEIGFPGAGPGFVRKGLFAARRRNVPPNLGQNGWISSISLEGHRPQPLARMEAGTDSARQSYHQPYQGLGQEAGDEQGRRNKSCSGLEDRKFCILYLAE
ncbi:PREDICTED: regulator of G-protein signaling 3-like, partial [Chlamydotis macqueenii]|uniref:regulator of G-protein signaling 3-like n=1 Tax=Chlamydotis macqueenii TaxID=187382 RepID=UPI000529B64E